MPELSLAQRHRLVDALLDCRVLQTPQSRNQLLADLPTEIARRIDRQPNDRQDVDAVVRACLQFAGGIEKLLEIVGWHEGDSLARQRLRAFEHELFAPPQPPPTVAPPPIAPPPDSECQAEYRYDVFLSHNSRDKASVERLAARLADEQGLQPFLDKWEMVPGEPWAEALERGLAQSATCAVFLGPPGFGPWHTEEMRVALDERVRNQARRVFVVLLLGADPTTLPAFLSRTTWVDFRAGLDDEEAFRLLVAGIRGAAPGR